MTPICNDPTCGHEGPHLHGVDVPKKVGVDDAQDIDSARRLLMASFGQPIEPGDIPDMTLRQIEAPKGSRPMEIAQVTASFGDDTPAVRARFGTTLSSAIGLPGLKLAKDEAEGYRTWTIGVRTNLDFDAVIATWKVLAAFEGIEYLRFDGLAEMGLWIVDTNPEADEPRFTVAGP
jgi:hypothetical protein